MDGHRDDPGDDDVTIVGEHELVAELRRIAASRPDPPGRPLPPPAPRPAVPRPTTRVAAADEGGDDADGDAPRVAWLVLAIVAAAAAFVALSLLR